MVWTKSRHFLGKFQSSLGCDNQLLKKLGTFVVLSEFRSFRTARVVVFLRDNLSATMFSHVVFLGMWTTCTVVPKKADIRRTAFTRIEAVTSPFTAMFSQPKKHPILLVENTTCWFTRNCGFKRNGRTIPTISNVEVLDPNLSVVPNVLETWNHYSFFIESDSAHTCTIIHFTLCDSSRICCK